MVEYTNKEILPTPYKKDILNYIEDSYCSTVPKLLFVFKSVYVQFNDENIVYSLYPSKDVSNDKIQFRSDYIFVNIKNLEDILRFNHDIIITSSLIIKINDLHIIKKEAV